MKTIRQIWRQWRAQRKLEAELADPFEHVDGDLVASCRILGRLLGERTNIDPAVISMRILAALCDRGQSPLSDGDTFKLVEVLAKAVAPVRLLRPPVLEMRLCRVLSQADLGRLVEQLVQDGCDETQIVRRGYQILDEEGDAVGPVCSSRREAWAEHSATWTDETWAERLKRDTPKNRIAWAKRRGEECVPVIVVALPQPEPAGAAARSPLTTDGLDKRTAPLVGVRASWQLGRTRHEAES